MGGREHVRGRVAVELRKGRIVGADAEAERPGREFPYRAHELEPLPERRVEVRAGQEIGDRSAPQQDARLRPPGPDDVSGPAATARREKGERTDEHFHGRTATRSTRGTSPPYCMR